MAAPPSSTENGQFGIVSDSDGNSAPAPRATGINQALKPLLDDNGRLIVRIAEQAGFINPGVLTRFTQGGVRAPATGVVVESVPVQQLDGIWGYNGNLLALIYVQLFNSAILPTSGVTAPDYIIPVPAGFSTFSLSERINFTTGYTVAASSTELVYTALATDDMWFATNYYL